MTHRAWTLLAVWCALLAAGTAWVHTGIHISADLRLFMPTPRNEAQRVLLQSVGESPASRLSLLAVSGDGPHALARISRALAQRLGASTEFELIANGAQSPLSIPERLLPYRYLITDSFDRHPLDEAQLTAALEERSEDMSSPAAAFVEEWLSRDPTLELMKLATRWAPPREPRLLDDVWFSADGSQALLVVQTRAAAFDPDGQSRALEKLNEEFVIARGASPAMLTISGSGYFSSIIKARTQREATWFGAVATLGLLALMGIAYRRPGLLLFGALPLLSGGLAGLVLVAILFDSVHGITLAFGFTLIGVAQDYPMHLFSHLRPGQSATATARGVWRPLMTGVASTCIAYLTFLLSGVVGLAQLACLTVTGLAVAALTTRFLLPRVLGPARRDTAESAFLDRLNTRIDRLPRPMALLIVVPLLCAAVLVLRGQDFWENDLSRLTPVPPELLRVDAALRGELATPDLRYLYVVSGATQEAVLMRLEGLQDTLTAAKDAGHVGSYEDPSHYLPSAARQLRRQQSLPDAESLRRMLSVATANLPFEDGLFGPFVKDVARARTLPPVVAADLNGTPLALRVGNGLLERAGQWHGLVSFYDVRDPAALARSLGQAPGTLFLDLKGASEELVSEQRSRMILCLELAGVLLVVVIWLALRRPSRVLRVLAPMVLTTLIIVALLRGAGVPLSLFHLISLVLAAGLGLDYALFFEHASADVNAQKRTLHALLVCALSTLLVFALLALSTVPVLRAIGVTVTLGVIFNFLLSALLSRDKAPA
jgi:predicted exporter